MKATAVINQINESKFFTAEWVSTGRAQVSNELLDSFTSEIEKNATKEAIITYYNENSKQLTESYYELNDEVSVKGFAKFIINEFAAQFNFNDGGNISYTLTPFFN